ncbi:AraC family transcriptional regulator [Burkholderia pseudomultivorans]|uniref:AraC family transcriptional regulator n=1 Tax=Burkholderia pseudomultivorans TaxID=1207504 RepID=UPI000755F605|nr:AraC family transcriptional regulator [Burkholderia pseudomultivorans]KWI51378.1 AraC family transcriptional regulator [Burkholderia pseudomultivorans]
MVTLVRAAALTGFAEVMRALGGDADKALRVAGLRPVLVREPDQLIDAALAVQVIEDAAEAVQCDTLGLRMAESRQLSHFGVVSLLLLHQPTLRDALATLIAYAHVLNESLAIQMEDVDGVVILREDIVAGRPMRQSVDLAIGVLYRMCAALLHERWRPQCVCFSHSAPRDLSVHKRLFACRLAFDAEFNGIVCKAADLDEPNPLADPTLARYAQTLVDAQISARDASIGQQVRRAIYLLLPSGRATCAGVAQGLGRSMRTLQRALDAEGLSFTTLLDEVRHDLARRYLANPHYGMGQIATMLGYASHSAFTRWFGAQFGCPPQAWRNRRHRG